MNWEFLWSVIGHISNILSIMSVMISFALWLSFGKLRKEIALAKIKFAEDHSKIAKDLQIAYNTIFVEEEKNNDNDAISQIRQQIYSINRNFTKLLQKEDLKCVKRLMACLKKTNDKIDLAELRKDLDFLIITFKERIYEY